MYALYRSAKHRRQSLRFSQLQVRNICQQFLASLHPYGNEALDGSLLAFIIVQAFFEVQIESSHYRLCHILKVQLDITLRIGTEVQQKNISF